MDTRQSAPDRANGYIRTVLTWIVRIGQAAAWLIMPILLLVLASVVLSAAKIGTIARWETDIFLFGSKLTLSSLGDLQWHLFGIMLMLTMAGALVSDAHVRVDFLRQHMSERTKDIVDLIGHLVLLLPFCAIVIFHSLDFTTRSFSMGEGSDYDGLYDRFLLKSFMPIGFGLLFIAGIGLSIIKLRALFTRKGAADD